MGLVPEERASPAAQDEEFAIPQELQSPDQKKLLDTVDALRAYGVGSFADLPQLIVCGIQSAGKSSVMEAISRVPFPRATSTCTRFATEVILRRGPTTSITVSIIPSIRTSEDRTPEELMRLQDFRLSLDTYDGFPDLFAKASEAMGLSGPGAKKSFSDDTLKVEVVGPNQPQLSLVDLPGLIVSSTDENVRLVENLVRRYMENSRSIILAVVTAGVDAENQGVLKLAKECDKLGKRTLGILTKPDLLENAPDKEEQWREVTRNEKFPFELGWHILRNVDSGRRGTTREERLSARDEIEAEYFKTSNFKAEPSRKLGVGIVSLRERLSKELFQQIQTHLPDVLKQIKEGISHAEGELAKMGQQRSEEWQQRNFLMEISGKFSRLCWEATQGAYNDEFFRGSMRPDRKLCAAILNAHEDFVDRVKVEGCGWTIVEDGEEDELNGLITENSAIEMVKRVIRHNRRVEFGLVNPAVIPELFFEYSRPLHDLAREHLEEQNKIISTFLYEAIHHFADTDTARRVYGKWLNAALQQKFRTAKTELEKILDVYSKCPMTANPSFNNRVSYLQGGKKTNTSVEVDNGDQNHVHMQTETPEPDSNFYFSDHKAQLALRTMEAYYNTTIWTFVDNILTLVVWAPVVMKLPDIFTESVVANMDNKTIRELAEESQGEQRCRADLMKKLKALEKGREECEPYNMPLPINPSAYVRLPSRIRDVDQAPQMRLPRGSVNGHQNQMDGNYQMSHSPSRSGVESVQSSRIQTPKSSTSKRSSRRPPSASNVPNQGALFGTTPGAGQGNAFGNQNPAQGGSFGGFGGFGSNRFGNSRGSFGQQSQASAPAGFGVSGFSPFASSEEL